MDAPRTCSAPAPQAALLVVLPNLRKGGTIAVLLSFSFLDRRVRVRQPAGGQPV